MFDNLKIEIDQEFEKLLPVLTDAEFEELEQNIQKYGLHDPIKLWEDTENGRIVIIDGHNRYKVLQRAKESGFDVKIMCGSAYQIMSGEMLPNRQAVEMWMLQEQLGRRNLSKIDKYETAQRFKKILTEEAKTNQSAGGQGLVNLTKVNIL